MPKNAKKGLSCPQYRSCRSILWAAVRLESAFSRSRRRHQNTKFDLSPLFSATSLLAADFDFIFCCKSSCCEPRRPCSHLPQITVLASAWRCGLSPWRKPAPRSASLVFIHRFCSSRRWRRSSSRRQSQPHFLGSRPRGEHVRRSSCVVTAHAGGLVHSAAAARATRRYSERVTADRS